MLIGYLKITLSFTIPFAVLFYAKQARLQHDRQEIRSIVQHQPDVQWELAHPERAHDFEVAMKRCRKAPNTWRISSARFMMAVAYFGTNGLVLACAAARASMICGVVRSFSPFSVSLAHAATMSKSSPAS